MMVGMSTTHTSPIPQQVAELRLEDSRADVQWHKGADAATRHHLTPSIEDPAKSVLSAPAYAARMGDSAWADGDRFSACYWYGYAAKAIRLDPQGGRAIAR